MEWKKITDLSGMDFNKSILVLFRNVKRRINYTKKGFFIPPAEGSMDLRINFDLGTIQTIKALMNDKYDRLTHWMKIEEPKDSE
jgi:hypothetical protein